ncbi:transketolase C-terminal domain-containing protein [Actinokineospora sp. NBRC 105648]|uniref:transketolase family protein n=1 Tax=Actinokineospora sp. NBRC 105648 TaxID=3032206 RepID=UPI0024A2962B|nr:transketolase C-terminal domain-containing protein [Actinokineospora sp. NBRC 105648]GLZ39406.1 transketolase [Actinokineospora sp. NBRC 105648]
MTTVSTPTMREAFVHTMVEAIEADERVALVLATISSSLFAAQHAAYPDRVINVGIREQAMIGVASGLALTGHRVVAHSYAPFLVERPYEQVKLDLGHQDVGAVLVSVGASHDDPRMGRTHQAPADVALFDTLPGWSVHVPGHPGEVGPLLRAALAGTGREYVRLTTRSNAAPMPVTAGFAPVRHGSLGVVVAVGPVLDAVLAATEGLDVTVLYAATVRPFDRVGLRAAVGSSAPSVVLVEPYLRGTSAGEVAETLVDVPHRQLSIGVRRDAEIRAYGSTAQHDEVHGLDAAGIGRAVRTFLLS